MGPRTLRLLEAVEQTGSLKAAAREAGFSYRSAWSRIKRVEAALGFKLIESRSGGEGGGHSSLTAEASEFVVKFKTFLIQNEKELNEYFYKYFKN